MAQDVSTGAATNRAQELAGRSFESSVIAVFVSWHLIKRTLASSGERATARTLLREACAFFSLLSFQELDSEIISRASNDATCSMIC